MGTKKRVMDHILDQIEIDDPGYLTYKKVFGKYALVLDSLEFALVVDSVFYLKATDAGRKYLGKVVKGIPFKKAQPHFIISKDEYENSEWFSELVSITINDLIPKSRSEKRKLRSSGV